MKAGKLWQCDAAKAWWRTAAARRFGRRVASRGVTWNITAMRSAGACAQCSSELTSATVFVPILSPEARPCVRFTMSPTADYEPVPTDSQLDPAPAPPHKPRSRLVTVRRVLLFSATILLVSFAAYKSNQWSADQALVHSPEASQEHPAEEIAVEPPSSAASNETDMSGEGKYSVG